MNIKFLVIGKTSQSFIRDGLSVYLGRLEKYVPVEFIEINVDPRSNSTEIMIEAESNAIRKYLKPSDHIVLCDESGKLNSSTEFATWLQKKMNSGIKSLCFVIGGAYGVSAAIRQNASETISFSPMTFTHDMVRLVAAEQLYRAHTILRGEKYHH